MQGRIAPLEVALLMKNAFPLTFIHLIRGLMVCWMAVGLLACQPPASPPRPTTTPIAQQPTATPSQTSAPATTSPTALATMTAAETPAPTSTATPTTTAIAPPTATPQPTQEAPVQVYETTITLPSYPVENYLQAQLDPTYNMPVFYFDRAQFEADAPTPEPVDYRGVVLENDYLRLTFLPELGGRLYSAVIKSTGQEVFYSNKVVKPSRYGILQPIEANWWLATGGLEWSYPTQEHGYRWSAPWLVSVSRSPDGATVTLSDLEPGRVGVSVDVTLGAESALFTVKPRLINSGSRAVPVQFWTNAVLALAPDTMSPQTQFTIPVEQITVHSRGEEGWAMPGEGEPAPWPVIDNRDLRFYDRWANHLGFFIPYMDVPFMGAYNPETDLGIARLVEPGVVPGNKIFAFSTGFQDRSYTDDGSQYFEIWGGVNTGFWPEDDILVAPGEDLAWEEGWWPLAGLGGLTWATDSAAIHLASSGNRYTLSAQFARPGEGRLTILGGETTILSEAFSADPASPLRWQFEAASGPIQVEIVDGDGVVLLSYQGE